VKTAKEVKMSHIQVIDKASGQVVESLPIQDAVAVAEAAQKARLAQPVWAALPVKERVRLLKLARKEFLKDKDKIRNALVAETGKAPFDVIGEIFSVCHEISHYSGKAVKWLKPRKVGTFPLFGKKGLVVYKPYGLVGVISPWNAPLNLAIGDMLPALYAGNAVIVKPSEITPLAVKYTVEAFNRVLPKNILQCLIGEGATGAALVDQVDMVAVTGSCQTGRRVMERASQRLIPVLLELGGKDPMIVLKDADMERATNAAAWGSCFMTGQVCMSIERIYVEKEIATEFKQKLKEKVQVLRTGPGLARDTMDYGPFTGPKQIQIVEDQLADALAKGAVIECGGSRIQQGESGVYFQPTLVTNVNHTMKLMTEETFGPVACVMEVRDAEEAIALANDSEYGLNASVWTRDITKGIAVATRLQSGNVCVNDAILNGGVHSLPFGGIKQSGVGSRHGAELGLRAFCYAQSLMIETRRKKSEMVWFPYQIKTAERLEKLMMFLYGR
jgi:acyl-CoA reductase-like NAD-dependent aldehyde dehydrogenase